MDVSLPPPPRMLLIKGKFWKLSFINNVFEIIFFAVNKDLY